MLAPVGRRMPMLRIRTENAELNMETKLNETELSVKQGEFNISVTLPFIRIDPTEAWKDLGLKGVVERARDIAQDAYAKGLLNIERVAQEGDKLAKDIRPNAAALFEIIQARLPKYKDYNVDVIPKHMVEVELDEGYVQGVYEPYEIEVHVPRKLVEMQYCPGKVEMELVYLDMKL